MWSRQLAPPFGASLGPLSPRLTSRVLPLGPEEVLWADERQTFCASEAAVLCLMWPRLVELASSEQHKIQSRSKREEPSWAKARAFDANFGGDGAQICLDIFAGLKMRVVTPRDS